MRTLNLQEQQVVAGGGPTLTEGGTVGGAVGGAIGVQSVVGQAGGWSAVAEGATLPATASTTVMAFTAAGTALGVVAVGSYLAGGALYEHMSPSTQDKVGSVVNDIVWTLGDVWDRLTSSGDYANAPVVVGANDGPLSCGMLYR